MPSSVRGDAGAGRGDLRRGSPTPAFTGVKVFTTTLARDREVMGEAIGRWLAENPGIEVVDRQVTQSSDRAFHCLSITLLYRERKGE